MQLMFMAPRVPNWLLMCDRKHFVHVPPSKFSSSGARCGRQPEGAEIFHFPVTELGFLVLWMYSINGLSSQQTSQVMSGPDGVRCPPRECNSAHLGEQYVLVSKWKGGRTVSGKAAHTRRPQ